MVFSVETRTGMPEKIGKYEILGVIGRGGMGVVYSARDPIIDRVVAIKTIRIAQEEGEDDQVGRLRMEARSAGKLQHPNIVTVYDFGDEGDLSYIVMEYVHGINLSRVIQKRRAIPLADKLNILMQVARGLAFAHEYGVVHRDMKPSNICITARGVAKILDFGLARFDDTKLTKTGYLSGTIAYMSPERFSGETGVQDDIFALGAVAYEFLAYRRAFPGESTPEIISKILGGPMPASISEQTGYPRELDLIILRAIDRDPEQRFRSALELEHAIAEFIRSDEYLEFIADETLSPQFQQPVDWSDDALPATSSPYSSGRSLGSVPINDSPTLQIASDHEQPLRTDVDVPAGEPTQLKTKREALRPRTTSAKTQSGVESASDLPPTELVPQRKPRRNLTLAFVAVAVLIAVALGVWVTQRSGPEKVPNVPPTVHPPPVVTDTASQETEALLATARTLADLVAQRSLTPDEKAKFADARRSLDQARMLVAQKDYAGGAVQAKQASGALRELLATRPPPDKAPPPDKTHVPHPPPVKTATHAPVQPPPKRPVPTETVATRTESVSTTQAPPPVVTESVAPPKPSRAELDREINAFMREIANAYQQKDVAFFREHSLRFNEQLADAIRNSPSKRVDITVESIKFIDDSNASVVALRTDTFAEANLPPGVQRLVFQLRRSNDGWKIVTFSRG